MADGEFEGVVPGRNLAHDTARVAQFGDLGEGGHGPGVPAGGGVGGSLPAVVAGGHDDGLHLFVRVQPGLAGLQLDEVEHLGLAGEHQVVEAEQDGGAPPAPAWHPRPPAPYGPLEGLLYVLGGGLGQVCQLLAGERGVVGGPTGADRHPW